MHRVRNILKQQNIEVSDQQLRTLEQYMTEILRLNEEINLTAITDRDDFIQKHFVDSLLCAGAQQVREAKRVCDIGTGAGFPGIPLAVVYENIDFVLADSLDKRVKIIRQLCESLEIPNVTPVHGRAEELARRKEYREGFDLCVSRAVANMNTLSEYCLPFLKVGGTFIAYKGPGCEAEIKAAAKAIEILGGSEAEIMTPQFEDVPFEHKLVYVKKIRQTPKTYPRKAGTPSRKPLEINGNS
ncbi:MAG: 16S rRNA (guanine(527)-N(7))-methyltransferase RsmG [Bacillota bacterium]|nr:16S rRNA (guanine(527)-N(7))-methyltransferase RsmG [Bacillota bacterium]